MEGCPGGPLWGWACSPGSRETYWSCWAWWPKQTSSVSKLWPVCNVCKWAGGQQQDLLFPAGNLSWNSVKCRVWTDELLHVEFKDGRTHTHQSLPWHLLLFIPGCCGVSGCLCASSMKMGKYCTSAPPLPQVTYFIEDNPQFACKSSLGWKDDWLDPRKKNSKYSISIHVPNFVLVLLDIEKVKEEQSPFIFSVDLCY